MDLSYPVSGLPSHQPLVVDLQISPLNALIIKHKAPRRATHDPGRSVPCSADCDLRVVKLWQSVAADWQRARNTGDTQSLWPLLTRVGHDFYCWFSGLKVSTKAVCRGLPGEPCSFRVPPPRCRAFDTATSIQNAARQLFTRALEHVARLRLRLADDCASADRFHEFQHHWLRVAARSSKFVDSADWFALFGSGILRVSQPQSCPSFDSIVQLVRQLEIESSKILALERSSRLNAWRQTCRRNWRDPRQKRFVYSWIRDAWPLPVASVRVPETNQISMNPTDIERVLWQKWQPIFCPSPDQEAVPDFNAFWERFGRYAVHAPVTLEPLSGPRLKAVILKMSNHTTGGADGWSIQELKVWPNFLFDRLADLLNDVETSGNWPSDLLLQIVSLIPKDDTSDDQRPISVATLAYRAWASVRAEDLSAWQERWVHPSQHGYRRGLRSVDPSWTSAAFAEHAWLSHSHRCGFSLDLAKAFDRIPHQILYNCLIASGLPENFCSAWLTAIREAKKYLKSAFGLGRAFHVSRGLPQGDALACFGMNLIMSLWSNAISHEVSVHVRSFADDATVESEDSNASVAVANLQSAVSITEEFTSLSGQKPNVMKCFAWATSRRGRKALASLKMHGSTITHKAHAKDLGCQVLFYGRARSSVIQTLFKKTCKAAQRARCAPLNLEEKSHLVKGAVSSLANYGLETCFVGDALLTKLRAAVVIAIWGLNRRFRSAHAVVLLFTQSHLTDPFQAQVCQSFLTLQRCLQTNILVSESWESWWRTAQNGHARGPVTLLWHLLSRIHWTWPSPWILHTHSGTIIQICDISPGEFAHHLRDAARIWCWQQAFRLHKHFNGVQHFGVDRVATLYMCNHGSLSPHSLRLLRSILVDAVWTLSRLWNAGKVDSATCSCGFEHQDTVHFFWTCSELEVLKSQHSQLFSIREALGPWPPCLELCGLVPADLNCHPHSGTQIACLVQSYLLDVVRRSWEAGWPQMADAAPKKKPVVDTPCQVETFSLSLPPSVPKLSQTTFPWPDAFADDLLSFLKTLTWPKHPARSPNCSGITWAELAVDFEIVMQKALPRNPRKHRSRKFRSYGAPVVPLLEAPDNLYTKTLVMSNACRSLARLLGTHVVFGSQTRYQSIPDLPGKHKFNGLNRRPVMHHEDATMQAIRTCLHDRLTQAVDLTSAAITAGDAPASNPVEAASKHVNLFTWSTPAPPSLVDDSSKRQPPKPDTNIPPPNVISKVTFDSKHDVIKVNNRWTCMNCPCTASYSNSARFKNALCLGDSCHAFTSQNGAFICTKCQNTAASEKEMHGKLAFACPGFPSKPETADLPPKKNTIRAEPTHSFHDVIRAKNCWTCTKCPNTCRLSNIGRFRKAQCLGSRAHCFKAKSKGFECTDCGAWANSEKQMRGQLTFPCPGPSKREEDFSLELPAKPNSQGQFVCKKCKRKCTKPNISRFAKTLCYGTHATTKADAIRASRCAAGLSSTGLPAQVVPRLKAFRKSDVNMEPD